MIIFLSNRPHPRLSKWLPFHLSVGGIQKIQNPCHAILCDPPFFSGYIEFGGVVVKFYSSVEITLYLLADFLLQYVTLFQSRDIVKNLVSL